MSLQTPRRSSESRQAEIIETVLKLAAEHSPGLITTREIADLMGITQGAIFRHFPNKEAIGVAVIGWVEKKTVRRIIERYRQLVSGLLAAAIASGEIAADLNISAAATLFIGTVQGLVMQSMLTDNVAALRGAAEQVFPLFLRSIRE
jgi:AcrR family transcriptional regulator